MTNVKDRLAIKAAVILLTIALLIAPLIPLFPSGAAAGESLLSPDDLREMKPAYEELLNVTADTLIAKGLLKETDKANWVAFHIADYMLNGGFGTIQIMYNPDLLLSAAPDDFASRIAAALPSGTLTVDTLVTFSVSPSLPLYDSSGRLLECAFRFTSSDGDFIILNDMVVEAVTMGASVLSMGEWVFWADELAADYEALLTIEALSIDESESYGACKLRITCDGIKFRVSEVDQ